ncbi:hypothetical protein DPEC_G00026460 [Dallia pectoralis]|uniref:Uncharacterized protein n=1 Tax=Dallia pectoralis TaxID=75939 RepID=A0ACC2HIG1_DALPE|nr:hypothetical protein DPEC_G00026460 [Dallia pectoralis]
MHHRTFSLIWGGIEGPEEQLRGRVGQARKIGNSSGEIQEAEDEELTATEDRERLTPVHPVITTAQSQQLVSPGAFCGPVKRVFNERLFRVKEVFTRRCSAAIRGPGRGVKRTKMDARKPPCEFLVFVPCCGIASIVHFEKTKPFYSWLRFTLPWATHPVCTALEAFVSLKSSQHNSQPGLSPDKDNCLGLCWYSET